MGFLGFFYFSTPLKNAFVLPSATLCAALSGIFMRDFIIELFDYKFMIYSATNRFAASIKVVSFLAKQKRTVR